jgi:hypothetical protein
MPPAVADTPAIAGTRANARMLRAGMNGRGFGGGLPQAYEAFSVSSVSSSEETEEAEEPRPLVGVLHCARFRGVVYRYNE